MSNLHPAATTEELELLSFLKSDNWQVRHVALSTLAGYSIKGHPRRNLLLLSSGETDAISLIKGLTTDVDATAHDAFSILINLSDSALVSKRIASEDFLAYLVTYIFHPASILADLASMLLSNLTKLDSAAKALLDMKVDGRPIGLGQDDDVAALELLLAAFDQGATVQSAASQEAIAEMKRRAASGKKDDTGSAGKSAPDEDRKSNCNFLASVFANVTAVSIEGGVTFGPRLSF